MSTFKDSSAESQVHTLRKEIGLIESITMVIGIVIGSGIFFKASNVFKNGGTPWLGIMAWVAGGIITLAAALTVAEIAAAIPRTGGVFVYLKELYGERWAFLYGWVQSVIYVPGASAALAIVFATQATYFIPMTDFQQKLLAIIMILIVMILNIISTKLGNKIQFISTIGKLIPILIIVVIGLIKGQEHSLTSAPFITGAATATGFGAAILGTLWAYDGWISVGNMAGEFKNPKRDLPRAITTGILIIIGVYVLFNLSIINVLPVSKVIASKKVATDASIALFGDAGASLIAVGILISIFGALNGYLMTGVRIPFAMGQDNLLPFSKFFGKVNARFETPLNSFVFEVILASLYVLSGSFDTLTNLVMFVLWIFFTMTVCGVFILRKKRLDIERPFSVPLYPLVPLVGIGGGIYIIISTLITDTTYALLGLLITLVGLPVYLYVKTKK